MKNKDKILDQDDFLFTYKNKEYGAFQLRKRLDWFLMISLVVGFLLVFIVYFSPFLYFWLKGEDTVQTEVIPVVLTPRTELISPPPILPEEQPKPPAEIIPPKVATKRFVSPEIRPDDEVSDEDLPPTVEELQTAAPSVVTQEGTDDIYQDYVIPEPKPEPEIEPEPEPAPKPERKVLTYVETWPSFPGGEQEMFRFIRQNLQYPTVAATAGIQGVVNLQFIVDVDGSIDDITVVRGIGGGCDEAAVDVVKKMPKWIPGEQNGIPVAVRYNLPIRFILQN